MSDDDEKRTPPQRRSRTPRAASPTERDLTSIEAKRAREREESARPEHVDDDITGNYPVDERDELRRIRAERDPVGAIVRIERKHDELAAELATSREESRKDNAATRTEVANARLELASTNTKLGEVSGKLSVVPDLISVLRESNRSRDAVDHLKVTTTLDVDKARQLSAIKVGEAKELEPLEARRQRRIRVTKWIGAIVGMPAAWELMKWLAGHFTG